MMRKDKIYVVVEEQICGTAEDNVILGYFSNKNNAYRFAVNKNRESKDYHYSIMEVDSL